MKKTKLLLLLVGLVVLALVVAGCGSNDTTTTTAGSTETTEGTTDGTTDTTGATETTESGDATEAEVIKLKFAAERPPTHVDMTHNYPGYFKMVEEATNGKYKFDIEWYATGTILTAADTYQGVVDGIVDIGHANLGYFAKRFPLILTLSQPGIAAPTSTAAMNKATIEFYDKYMPEELQDTHILFLYACGPGWIHNNDKYETLDALKGKRIRSSATSIEALKLLGADPIAIPSSETYEAAQKKTVDAILITQEALEGWKFAELFQYSLAVPYIYPSEIFFVAMNKDKWNELPEDLQKAMDEVRMDASIRAGTIWDYAHESGREFAKTMPSGHEDQYFSDAETAKLLEVLKPLADSYAKLLDDEGLPGKEIVEDAKKFVEEANKDTFPEWSPETDKYMNE